MILQTADGAKYRVVFRHYLPCRPTRIKGKLYRGETRWPLTFDGSNTVVSAPIEQVFSRRPKTVCLIYQHSDQIPLVQTEATCSPRDVFSKKLGRRIALGRALTELAVMNVITGGQRDELMADYVKKII